MPADGTGSPKGAGAEGAGHKTPPAIVTPTTKVTVAFPFSTVKIHESSEALVELATLVAGLSRLVEGGAGGSEAARLAEQAEALVERLRTAR